jgi:3-hydroxyacyl-CoA dehydrogenase
VEGGRDDAASRTAPGAAEIRLNGTAPRVAVLGAGETGSGWAALCAAAGWPVAIYDADSTLLHESAAAVASRAQALAAAGLAESEYVANGVHGLRVGRSLLHAVTDADWIIDASAGDVAARVRFLEQVEQVARRAAVTTSAAGGLEIPPPHGGVTTALAARLRHPDRFLSLHAAPPVERAPVVELMPGPLTDRRCVEDVEHWIRALGRVPIVLERESAASAAERIVAAVWRECAALVIDGIVAPADVERLLAAALAPAWLAEGTAAGASPFATRLRTMLAVWPALSTLQGLDAETVGQLVRRVEAAPRRPE